MYSPAYKKFVLIDFGSCEIIDDNFRVYTTFRGTKNYWSEDMKKLYKKGEPIATPEIYKGEQNTIKLGFDRDIWLTLPKDRFVGMKATLTTMQPLIAPYTPGQKAGVMKLTQNDKLIAEIPVVALESVPVAGLMGRGWDAIRLLFK